MLDAFKGFPCFRHHSIGTFIRLLIPDRLAQIAEKVLYLDADLLCLGRIDALIATDLSGAIAAAVPDQQDTTAATQIEALALADSTYFNAGVLYIHTGNWVANDTQNMTLTILSSRELRFADQDALNIALNGQVTFLDERWNFRYHLVAKLSSGVRRFDAAEQAVFMHFTGPVKPWQDWCLHEARLLFVRYQALTPWADVPLDKPRTARELKLFSKFLVKQGRVAEGVWWHLKYLVARTMRSIQKRA